MQGVLGYVVISNDGALLKTNFEVRMPQQLLLNIAQHPGSRLAIVYA